MALFTKMLQRGDVEAGETTNYNTNNTIHSSALVDTSLWR